MLAFGIDRFKILETSLHSIRAVVGWPNDGSEYYDEAEEVQEIEWTIQNTAEVNEALTLLEYLVSENHLDNDRIVLSQGDLRERAEITEFDTKLDALLSIRVDMIDDGKKTDFFFFHF